MSMSLISSLHSSNALPTLPQHSTSLPLPSNPLPSTETVAIVSKCTVFPDRKTELCQLQLSVSDLPMLSCHYIQKGLFFTPPPFPIDNLIASLTSSLSRALAIIPALAGRLATLPDGRIVIDCNDSGVEFSYAVAPSLDLAILLPPSTDSPSMIRSLFPLTGAVSYQGHFLPLASFQLTELSDGSVFLGAAVNHSIVDGTSFWNFFNTWAALCRGLGNGSGFPEPPDFRRNYFGGSKAVIRFPGGSGPEVTFNVNAPLRERFFHFSREAIQELKYRANKETLKFAPIAEIYGKQMHDQNANKDDKDEGEISSFQSLCAHLWRAVTRARKRLSPEEITILRMAVNCRHRLSPPVSANYFGNALQSIPTTATVGEIVSQDLRWVARMVHRNVKRHDDEVIRNGVATWEAEPRCYPLGNPNGAGVTMGSSHRFPMYNGNDFGWGRPVAVRSGKANKFDGKMSAFPARNDGGSVELEVCLEPEAMAALLEDEEFMNYVS